MSSTEKTEFEKELELIVQDLRVRRSIKCRAERPRRSVYDGERGRFGNGYPGIHRGRFGT
jgi:hypothetical protein